MKKVEADDRLFHRSTNADRAALVVRDQRISFGRRVPSSLKNIKEPVLLEDCVDYVGTEVLDVDLIIQGVFSGTVHTTGSITVAGHAEGNFYCSSFKVEKTGEVHGNVYHAKGSQTSYGEILGILYGLIRMSKVSVKSGGIIDGSVEAEALLCADYGSEVKNGHHKIGTFAKIMNGGFISGEIKIDSAILSLFEGE